MTGIDFITELFVAVDDKLTTTNKNHKHPKAKLYPSEVVTIALLFALKGVGNRAFYRWIANNYKSLFPNLPERTRLFRLFNRHHRLTDMFMAHPSLIGVIDTYGIELIHPRREGRSSEQIGKKGISNQRWIVGGKLCLLVNHLGVIVDWDCDSANVYDGSRFQHIVESVRDQMVVFADTGFVKVDWLAPNLRICQRGQWNSRMLIETILSMLTQVCHLKQVTHRCWAYFKTRLAFTMALFNLLVQWEGLSIDDDGFVPLSIAQFSL
jgi:hypothetical protein